MKISGNRWFLASMIVVLTLSGCARQDGDYGNVIGFVRQVAADTSLPAHNCVASYDTLQRMGSIAVVGPFEETALMADYLLACDQFDNGSGRSGRDGLPDFCGETIDAVFDVTNSGYEGYISHANEEYLRELAVKNVLFSVSDSCAVNPYDVERSLAKISSKIVIFTSSIMSGYGYGDVKDLFRIFGKKVRLISPVHAMSASLLKSKGLDPVKVAEGTEEADAVGKLNVGVWAAADIFSSGAYANVLNPIIKDESNPISGYICFCPEEGMSALEAVEAFLDSYISSEYPGTVSAIMLDMSMPYTASELNDAAADIKACKEDHMIRYKGILADDFRFIDPYTSIAEQCYSIMRSENIFTHKISYPRLDAYISMPAKENCDGCYDADGNYTDAFRYGRKAGSSDETFRYVDFSFRYLDAAKITFINENTVPLANELFR